MRENVCCGERGRLTSSTNETHRLQKLQTPSKRITPSRPSGSVNPDGSGPRSGAVAAVLVEEEAHARIVPTRAATRSALLLDGRPMANSELSRRSCISSAFLFPASSLALEERGHLTHALARYRLTSSSSSGSSTKSDRGAMVTETSPLAVATVGCART